MVPIDPAIGSRSATDTRLFDSAREEPVGAVDRRRGPDRPGQGATDDQPETDARERVGGSRHRGLRLGLRLLRIGPLLILLALVVVLSFLSPFFFTTRNLGNVLAATAAIAVLSLGQLLVILTRGIDLSVGSTLALASVVGALVYGSVDSGPVVVVAMLLTGLLVGAVNGIVYVKGRLPHPFIITLAMLSIARGLALWLSGGQPIRGMPPIVNAIGGGSIGWFPVSAILVLGIAVRSCSCSRPGSSGAAGSTRSAATRRRPGGPGSRSTRSSSRSTS